MTYFHLIHLTTFKNYKTSQCSSFKQQDKKRKKNSISNNK